MKAFALLLAIALSACVATTDRQNAQTKIPVADGYQPGETLVREPDFAGEAIAYRAGHTPSGLLYSYFPDGSGGVSLSEDIADSRGWSIACRLDKITDKRECSATGRAGGGNLLLVWYGDSGTPSSICIVGHDFPGRRGAIRIDQRQPVRTDREGCAPAGALWPQILTGATVVTEHVEWPYDWKRQSEGSLAGIREAHDLVRFIRTRIDAIGF